VTSVAIAPAEADIGTAVEVKPRLDHVDAMRPVKQVGVVSTHSFLFFASQSSVYTGATVMLLHASREAFFFVSACMLMYAYGDVAKLDYRRFYSRRALSIVIPYACWTLIYWALELHFPLTSWTSELHSLGMLFATGYYQLYYLVVIAQFYLVFPLMLILLRATRRHPVWVMALSGVLQLLITSLEHWDALPTLMEGTWATRDILSYQFYLFAGCVAAMHFKEFNRWIVDHKRDVVWFTAVGAILAEGWYLVASQLHVGWMGMATDVFQPVVLPFNIGAIGCLYLVGRWLVGYRRTERVRLWARRGSDSAYGIFLSQMLFITLLVDLGWGKLDQVMPWGVVVALTVAVVFTSGAVLSLVLNHTPLSRALTGQPRLRGKRRPLHALEPA
jgi:hypothetical protein